MTFVPVVAVGTPFWDASSGLIEPHGNSRALNTWLRPPLCGLHLAAVVKRSQFAVHRTGRPLRRRASEAAARFQRAARSGIWRIADFRSAAVQAWLTL